jgi:glycerophosphoryl diester phosphodiesterase
MTGGGERCQASPLRSWDRSGRPLPLISAHRAGLTDDTSRRHPWAALRAIVNSGCDLVELDVRLSRDGVAVVEHEADVVVGGRSVPVGRLTVAELAQTSRGCLPLDDALRILAGRAAAHLDVKEVETTDDLLTLIDAAATRLGAANVVVTGLTDEDIATVRAWSRRSYPELLVGLAVGRDLRGLPPQRLLRTALEELAPGGRLRRSDANLVVSHKDWARVWIRRWARRRGLPLLVWTVNKPSEMRRWLTDPYLWALTTDQPLRALTLRPDSAQKRGRWRRCPRGRLRRRRRLTRGALVEILDPEH